MPFIYVLGATCPGLPSLIVSACFGAALLCLLNQILRHWQLGGVRFLLIGAMALQPLFLRHCIDGSSHTTIAFLTLVSAYGIVLWITERKLRALVLIGIGGSLLFLSSLAMAAWLILALGVLALTPPAEVPAPSEKGAVGLLVLWPILYGIGLWALANWLILGDGFYLFRSLAHVGADSVAGETARRELARQAVYGWPAAGMVLLFGAAVRKRDAGGVSLALIGLSPLVVAVFLATLGYLWDPLPVLLNLLPLAVLALGYLYRLQSPALPSQRAWRYGALAFCAFMLVWYRPGAGGLAHITDSGVDELRAQDNVWLAQIRREVQATAPKVKVFVCGYDSFRLLGSRSDPVFQTALDFNFYQSVKDYRGYQMYLLIHQPVGASAFESIHWKYPLLFSRGHRNLLYYKDWGDWRLFELVQAPRKENELEDDAGAAR
jgi:hypothetical protein